MGNETFLGIPLNISSQNSDNIVVQKPAVVDDEADIELDFDEESPSSKELKAIAYRKLAKTVAAYAEHYVSKTEMAKRLGISRFKLYDILQKSGVTEGIVNYERLANLHLCDRCARRFVRIKRVKPIQPDEEW